MKQGKIATPFIMCLLLGQAWANILTRLKYWVLTNWQHCCFCQSHFSFQEYYKEYNSYMKHMKQGKIATPSNTTVCYSSHPESLSLASPPVTHPWPTHWPTHTHTHTCTHIHKRDWDNIYYIHQLLTYWIPQLVWWSVNEVTAISYSSQKLSREGHCHHWHQNTIEKYRHSQPSSKDIK